MPQLDILALIAAGAFVTYMVAQVALTL